MKKHKSFIILFLYFTLGMKAQSIIPYFDSLETPLTGYVLRFHDEFDSGKVDETVWQYRLGAYPRLASYGVKENVAVKDGNLILTNTINPFFERCADSKQTCDKQVLVGGLITKQDTFGYGYYESRLKVPVGAGFHTAFWALNNTKRATPRRQEIDFIEQESATPHVFTNNYHDHSQKERGEVAPKLGRAFVPKPPIDFSNDFQIIGCEYTPETLKFYLNGKLLRTLKTDLVPIREPMNIWLSVVAIKVDPENSWQLSHWTIDKDKLPHCSYFDYVRYFSN
jgi:beta-glucanase (GH16 family)